MKLFAYLLAILATTAMVVSGARHPFTDPIVPANPDAAGKELAAKLLSMRPAESLTNEATLTIFSNRTERGSVSLSIEILAAKEQWTTTYVVPGPNSGKNRYEISRANYGATTYHFERSGKPKQTLAGEAAFMPIAGSDFTLAEVGLEFLHWPTQRLLSKEVFRQNACDKLESLAPKGWAGDYVRVLSWFDIDTGGPVLVEAYNAEGKLVKDFRPTELKKVDGQFQVEVIEMNTYPTKTRTIIRFDLKSSAQ